MEEIACACCGRKMRKSRMIRRKLNGKDLYCCSLRCEVEWEKVNLFGVCG